MWILMEVPESTQRHTRVRLKQIELVLFTLCDGSFNFWDVAAEISAQVMVRRQITRSIYRIGSVVGIGLPVGFTVVASPTYEPQHYKTNKMTCALSEDSDQPGHPPSQWVAEDPMFLHADSEDWSDWVDVQADLSLCWAQRSFCWFGRTVVHIKASHAVKRS